MTTPANTAQLQKHNSQLMSVISELIDIYVRNRGTEHEFIACITDANYRTRDDSKAFKAFAKAQRVLPSAISNRLKRDRGNK